MPIVIILKFKKEFKQIHIFILCRMLSYHIYILHMFQKTLSISTGKKIGILLGLEQDYHHHHIVAILSLTLHWENSFFYYWFCNFKKLLHYLQPILIMLQLLSLFPSFQYENVAYYQNGLWDDK